MRKKKLTKTQQRIMNSLRSGGFIYENWMGDWWYDKKPVLVRTEIALRSTGDLIRVQSPDDPYECHIIQKTAFDPDIHVPARGNSADATRFYIDYDPESDNKCTPITESMIIRRAGFLTHFNMKEGRNKTALEFAFWNCKKSKESLSCRAWKIAAEIAKPDGLVGDLESACQFLNLARNMK